MVIIKTNIKIKIAMFLRFCIIACRIYKKNPNLVDVKRHGINWALDLDEGIDLAIFLFGRFEYSTYKAYKNIIKPGDTILDIGANIGAHTLQFAELIRSKGEIYAFEPTSYAYNKLKKNISINPNLELNIKAFQIMLNKDLNTEIPENLYSSWPLGNNSEEVDKGHKGRLMDTEGASSTTLSSFAIQKNIEKVNFIKLDVDGNEYDVLLGSRDLIQKFKPIILMELAFYPSNDHFSQLLDFFKELSYSMKDLKGAILPLESDKLLKKIPVGSSINVILSYNN